MAKPKPDPVAWAKAQRRNPGGRACQTCSCKGVTETLRTWVKLWRSGEINISLPQARAFLVEHFAYPYTTSALRTCLANHHGYTQRG